MPRGRRRSKEQYRWKSEQDIRSIARNLRKSLGIDQEHAPDLSLALLRLNTVYPRFRLKEVGDEDLPNAEAKAYCKASILKVRKSVLSALGRYGDGRSRWTIAHELGHLALQHPRSLYRVTAGRPIRPRDQKLEEEANIFASEFLIPSHLASPQQKAGEISSRFQVSLAAAYRRHQDLNRTSTRANSFNPSVFQTNNALLYTPTGQRTAFVAMEFSVEMDRLYSEIIKPAIEESGFLCKRGDEIHDASFLAADIRKTIAKSDLLIAEISGSNPNVMHEIGLAQSLEKHIILICKDGYSDEEIPFNIRHIHRICYPNDAGGGPLLRRLLVQKLAQVLRQ